MMSGSVNREPGNRLFTERPVPIEDVAPLYEAGWSLLRLSEHFAIPKSRIRLHLIKADVKMRPRGVWMNGVADLGALNRGKRYRPKTEETRAKISAHRKAYWEKHSVGVKTTPNGYVEFTRGEHKGRAVHRVVAEEKIGRPLLRSEDVHHDDHIRSNNDPGNLNVMPKSEHIRLHRLAEIAAGNPTKRGQDGRFCK